MAEYTETATVDVNSQLILLEIGVAISPAVVSGIGVIGFDVYVTTDVALDGSQLAAMSSAVANHDPEPLPALIGRLAYQAGTYYQQKMDLGFTHATKQFPLTSAAIGDWSSLNQSKDDPSMTYPIKIPSANGTQYLIVDSSDVSTMFENAVQTGKANVDAYSTALDAIVTSVTKESAQAVYDAYAV